MIKQTLLGIDTGGTFTDFVFLDPHQNRWQVHKVLSTPKAPQDAILRGIRELGLEADVAAGKVKIIHGTTVATNAALEGKGVRTAYITNTGLADVIRIGRQVRSDLYSLHPDKQTVPVDKELLFEVPYRLDASGRSVANATPRDLEKLRQQVDEAAPEAIAINLLFSFLNPEQEKAVAALFEDRYFVSRSSEILPEYREYERGASTWVNSWLGPKIETYLKALKDQLGGASLAIMQSSGLTIAADLAAKRAVNLLLSGPAGGLSAALHIGEQVEQRKLLTFDMGGTSTDVALIDQRIRLTSEGSIGGIPIAIPMADIHTIGAGGGSIAYVDPGGLLKVGPESAGADPGPACYGQGGVQPTVTDANLFLGHLDPSIRLADGLNLDLAATDRAITKLAEELSQSKEQVAAGIIAIANEHMIQALRVISIQQGFDPREFSLVCFGGAGGLHVCDVADALEITEIIVPIHSGVLSALGMLTTKPGRELSQTVQLRVDETSPSAIDQIISEIVATGSAELKAEGVTDLVRRDSLDLRYQGQTSTLNISYNGDLQGASQAFAAAHQSQFGHKLDRPIELLNCRVHLEARDPAPTLPKQVQDSKSGQLSGATVRRSELPVNQTLSGPGLIIDDHATVRVTEGWHYQVDAVGHLTLSKTS